MLLDNKWNNLLSHKVSFWLAYLLVELSLDKRVIVYWVHNAVYKSSPTTCEEKQSVDSLKSLQT